ncbi:hypothetical protein GCM10028805_00240 [Spirosoma harenae]
MENNYYNVRYRQSWLVMMIWAISLALTGGVLAQTPLALTQPAYNCSTGAITFNTSGGDGTPIEYMAPGITSWTSNPNQILDECARSCADMPPFQISARQSGQVVTYTWSRQDYCANVSGVRVSPINDMTVAVGQSVYFVIGGAFSSAVNSFWSVGASGLPPGVGQFFRQEGPGSPIPTWVLVGTPTTPGTYTVTAFASANGRSASTTFRYFITGTPPLALTTPTYDCISGAFTFNTSGGDGTPIEFMAIGITGWTTNPAQFVDLESRTVNDVKPFTLMARQSGQVVTLSWDLKAACGRARIGVDSPGGQLSLTVLGNPVHEQLKVLLKGAQGQSVQFRLTDSNGRLLENRTIGSAGVAEEQIFRLDQSGPGLLLLQATTNTQTQNVKIIKQ